MRMITDFHPDHLGQFANFAGQENLVSAFDVNDLPQLYMRGSKAVTAFNGNVVIGCGGIARLNDYRGMAWMLFCKTNPADFLFMDRAVRAFLDRTEFLRVESYVNPNMHAAMRWIAMLGFTIETPYIPYYFPDGQGASSWVRYN